MSYPPYTPLPTYPLPIPPLEVGSLAIPANKPFDKSFLYIFSVLVF